MRIWRKTALVGMLALTAFAAAMAASTTSTTTVTGAADPIRTVAVTGMRLTEVQAQVLRVRPHLTTAQARVLVAGESTGARLAAWGSGQSSGPCGTAIVQGDSFGNWSFSLSFNTEVVGIASAGGVGVSTNAMFNADSKSFGVAGSYVYHDALRDGSLNTIGWGATATTLQGWAVTTGAWFCDIDVTAPWQW